MFNKVAIFRQFIVYFSYGSPYDLQVGFLQKRKPIREAAKFGKPWNSYYKKIVVITCTCNFAAISSEYIFIVSKILKNMVQ